MFNLILYYAVFEFKRALFGLGRGMRSTERHCSSIDICNICMKTNLVTFNFSF